MSASDDQDVRAQAVDTAAALFGIAMQPAWREAAVANFNAIAIAAQLVMSFPLVDEAEYGPVFQA